MQPTCWKPDTIFAPFKELLGHKDVSTTMMYTHVLNKGATEGRADG
jgi:integrase